LEKDMTRKLFTLASLVSVLCLPAVGRAEPLSCAQYKECGSDGEVGCEEAWGHIDGAVGSVGSLLGFVGQTWQSECFADIINRSGGDESMLRAAFEVEIADITQSCSRTVDRSLNGVALQAAGAVCTPNWRADIEPLFQDKCGACHIQGSSGFLNFAKGAPDLVRVPSTQAPVDLVVPGDLSNSYLYAKLNGTYRDLGGSGSSMPLGGMLSPEEIGLVGAWIQTGARQR
jgi:hypothetical protein